jgi:hypothetical protein
MKFSALCTFIEPEGRGADKGDAKGTLLESPSHSSAEHDVENFTLRLSLGHTAWEEGNPTVRGTRDSEPVSLPPDTCSVTSTRRRITAVIWQNKEIRKEKEKRCCILYVSSLKCCFLYLQRYFTALFSLHHQQVNVHGYITALTRQFTSRCGFTCFIIFVFTTVSVFSSLPLLPFTVLQHGNVAVTFRSW